MNRLKEIKNIADLKELLFLHKESIKKAALPVMVVAALLFFWLGGENESDIVEETDRPVSEIIAEESSEDNLVGDNTTEIYVDISGCVYNPGVYKVSSGTRLFQLIEKAGGLTEDADIDSINQAEQVYDGQKILIHAYSANNSPDYQEQSSSNKININSADSSKLQEIPGIGPATAQKIIEYRNTVGRFKSIEDIKNVSGIGDKTYESLKEYITV